MDGGGAQGVSSRSREVGKGVHLAEKGDMQKHSAFHLEPEVLTAKLQGDWRGISKDYVTTRTPTQVASHAQKYFIRHNNQSKRKRRTSLFDLKADADVLETVWLLRSCLRFLV